MQHALPATWPDEGGGSPEMTFALDPAMPAEAKADFRAAAIQFSSLPGSAIESGTTLVLKEVRHGGDGVPS